MAKIKLAHPGIAVRLNEEFGQLFVAFGAAAADKVLPAFIGVELDAVLFRTFDLCLDQRLVVSFDLGLQFREQAIE